ncbi:hypothetical protein HMPREF1544_07466 [Mucor circinelloides 1006PhL]|uniref:HCP-like protein n=1 Tax=Mucor circinelloides f. circinelloides (strain 1006PhL) TaxID=1220926 RepID=S2K0P1_MUCC1|nr:hypothetical protein HMPREF1544_07466 [Mucor circinelloides 1006PhL]
MESADQAIQSLFSGTAAELHLLTAVELINNASTNNHTNDEEYIELAKQALKFLRIKAAKGDVEAKIKLSTILDRRDLRIIKGDTEEATLWARSVFDRRLSASLAPCVTELIALTEQEDDKSLIERLVQRADQIQAQQEDPQLKKKKKLIKSMCYLVGILFIDGTGLEQDVPRGINYLTRASETGHEGAGIELAKILSDPYKYPKQYNIEKSLEIYEAVAERKSGTDARALTDLARVYYEGSDTIPRNIDKAYKYARRIAESIGEQYCQFIVGDVLLHPPKNSAMKQDVQQAVFWLTQSGEQGFPLAIETLSKMYFEGKVKGIKKDYEQARHWCLMGDDIWPSGLGYCQTCLGDMFRQGLGVPKDLVKSFEYYQKAASQQDAPQNYARYMLGEMFFKGDGWDHNHALAADYYKMAANENYEPAMKRLAELRAIEEENKRSIEKAAAKRGPWKIWSMFGSKRKTLV